MHNFTLIKTKGDPGRTVNSLLAGLVEKELVQGVLTLAVGPFSSLPMPSLLCSIEQIKNSSPLAPAAGVSAAVHAARISRGPEKFRTAAVLRPCELRALVELAKLNQARLENLVLISMECPGRLENRRYLELRSEHPDLDVDYYLHPDLQAEASGTCLSCTDFIPEYVHLGICLLGLDLKQEIGISWHQEQGEELARVMEFVSGQESDSRRQAIKELEAARKNAWLNLQEKTAQEISTPEGLQKAIGDCLGCFNCQRACPVCFCRDCVSSREAFEQDPEELYDRGARKGSLRLPTDLTMFHLTRLAHMAHACVGCGQCSSVCPSRIPLADIFRTTGASTQEELGYRPGRSPDEPVPLVRFSEEKDT